MATFALLTPTLLYKCDLYKYPTAVWRHIQMNSSRTVNFNNFTVFCGIRRGGCIEK